MAVRLKKRSYPEEEFQMAPMIDMVFLLLVFFMTVSTLAQSERLESVELPESYESEVPEDIADRGIVSLDAEGKVYAGTTQVTIAEMQRRLRETLAENPELRVTVRADKNTSYGEIKKVLQACAEAGAYDVIYATYQR
ncbi:MAG: ExbD/TolR family protein [Opitutales bacterium]